MNVFRSQGCRISFIALETEGNTLMNHLGITHVHYKDAEVAKKWLERIVRYVEYDDVLPKGDKIKTIKKLESIYEGMI